MLEIGSSDDAALAWAHPLVREWFLARFGSATEPQQIGWPHILSGKSTLISAPTGSGKTLSAFLACIDALVRKAIDGKLEDKTEVVYVSPLKALSNDIQKNLDAPLAEISSLAEKRGINMMPIRTAVRTGDTLMTDRRAMLKRPPHILVTTPESLYILLTADKSRANLREVKTMIVDEIHAVADDKRGAHLCLTLERLDQLCEQPPVRIGLSATQKPIETVARFLVGNGRALPEIVNVGHARKIDFTVEVPGMPLGPVASKEQWDEIYDRLAELVGEHRSTLIFVNTRRLAERVTLHLAERLGEEAVAAHHGSLSRKLRHEAERKLKNGELRVLVATASLELGIDVGTVDLACLVSSPRSIAVALQRIGRAGHWRGAIPKGRIFPTSRDELVECAALVKAIKEGDLDRLAIPECPLDILAQQIVAMCSAQDWTEDDLYKAVTHAAPYADLSKTDFERVLEVLSEGISARRGRYGAYLLWNKVDRVLKGRRGARLAAITSGGAIPETAMYNVVMQPDETVIGTLHEDFAVESLSGDVFLLGNASWRIRRVEANKARVLVEDAHGAAPTIPFWLGEAPGRTDELSAQVGALRQRISDMTPDSAQSAEALKVLVDEYGLDKTGAEQVVEYILEGRAVLGAMPTTQTIIAERFFDEGGGMQLILHAPFGARINKAWGLALRKCFCRSFNFELQAAATDNGLNISLGEQHSFPLGDVFNFLSPRSVQHVLEQASLASPIFTTRFRWDATRSLALLRFQGGKKVPPHLQRMRTDDLLAAVFPDAAACQDNSEGDIVLPDHPLIKEVMKDVLTEAMDLPGLIAILEAMQSGEIRCLTVDTPVPSAFSHEILNANPYAYLDDAPLEERRARAVELRRVLPEQAQEVGALDQAAIALVRDESWPDLRDHDELHDFLQTVVALPDEVLKLASPDRRSANLTSKDPALPNLISPDLASSNLDSPETNPSSKLIPPAPQHSSGALRLIPTVFSAVQATAWNTYLEDLAKQKRAAKVIANGKTFWVPAERKKIFESIHESVEYLNPLADVDTAPKEKETSIIMMLQGWLAQIGPVTALELADLFALSLSDIDFCLLRLESSGAVLRGNFRTGSTPTQPETLEWCDRRLLARIHKLTVATLRKAVEPVTAAQFMNWLTQWQHVAIGSQLSGDERSTLEVIRQLQGFEISANAWESQIFKRRLKNYSPAILDRLCLTGKVGWGRLSPHPATLQASISSPPESRTSTSEVQASDSKARKPTPGARASRPLLPPPVQESARIWRVHPTSVAPIAFYVREDSDWLAPKHPAAMFEDNKGLSNEAVAVKDYLKQRGASFFDDITRGTNRLPSEIENALWELVAAGLVTADGFDNLRALIDPKRRSGQGRGRMQRPRNSTGRWSIMQMDEVERGRQLESTCWVLLRRYGVVIRDALEHESIIPRWRELLMAFRRLEDRGEIRGGRFVSGFVGEQFALPEAVESLRASRNRAPESAVIVLSAADPLNLIGSILPGKRTPATSSNTIMLRDGMEYIPPVQEKTRLA